MPFGTPYPGVPYPTPTPGVPSGPMAPGGAGATGLPSWAGPAISLIGGIFQGIGRNRQRGATRAEDARQEDEARRRARAKAALMRGILQASGYGNMMTDEQMVDLLTRTGRRNNTEGGVFGDIGGLLEGAGHSATLGNAPATTRSNEFWNWLDEMMQSAPRPTPTAVP